MSALEAHWQEAALERSDKAFLALARLEPVEIRPVPRKLTAEEREEWQAEYCRKWEYIDSTTTTNGHYRIVDNEGRVTTDASFTYAMELAAEKFRRANGG